MNFLTASVDIKVDDSKLPSQLARAKNAVTRAVDRMEGAFKRMSTAFISAWKKMTRYAKWAVLGIAAIATASIKMAADVIESENLYKESMGRMADATKEWSKEMSKALYLNEFEVRKYVGTFNVMLLSMGIGEEQAAEMSRTMTQLTYDMASFYNLKTEGAFGKLQSGIVGMSRPLQALGILVKESTIEAYALRTGLIKEGQEMTELQKVLARYGTIMEATTKSQGDMLRTIDESANVFRGLWSQVKLVAISFGDALLPAVTKVAKQMRDWLSANQQKAAELFVDVIEDMTLGIARFAEEIIALPVYWKILIITAKEFQMEVYKTADAMTNLDELFAWIRGDTKTYKNEVVRLENEIKNLSEEVDDLADSYVNSGSKIRKFFDDLRREQAKPEVKPDFITTFPPVKKYAREPFSWEKPPQKITAEHIKAANEIEEVWREMWLREQETAYHAMRAPIIAAEKQAMESAERRKRIAEDIATAMASSWSGAIDSMMFEGKKFWDAMKDMARDLVRTIAQIIIYKKIAEPMAYGIMGLPVPTAQHGGEVTKTGLAVIHKGETYSGVNGGYGRGNLEVHIHNEGSEKLDISSAQEYMVSDRRIVDVTTKAMTTNKRFQNSIKQAAR